MRIDAPMESVVKQAGTASHPSSGDARRKNGEHTLKEAPKGTD